MLVASYAFSFQLLCDFAGYSCMAVGVGRLMGFRLTTNFRAPYLASNLRDFWSCWHVSLTRWFGNYVYRTLRNATGEGVGSGHVIGCVLLTFLLVGLYFRKFPLVFVFAVHHVCNEVYLMGRTLPRIQGRDTELFRWSTLLLHAFAYLTILRSYGAVAEINPEWLLTGYVVSLCLFLFALLRVRKLFAGDWLDPAGGAVVRRADRVS